MNWNLSTRYLLPCTGYSSCFTIRIEMLIAFVWKWCPEKPAVHLQNTRISVLHCLPSLSVRKIFRTWKAADSESYWEVTGCSVLCISLPRCTLMTSLVRVRLGEWFITQNASGWWARYSRMCEAGCLAEINIATDVKPTMLLQLKINEISGRFISFHFNPPITASTQLFCSSFTE